MNGIVKELIENPRGITLYSCLEIEYFFTRYIHKHSGFVVTQDYETYFFIDNNKCRMEIYLLESIVEDEDKKNDFIELSDNFFWESNPNVYKEVKGGETSFDLAYQIDI